VLRTHFPAPNHGLFRDFGNQTLPEADVAGLSASINWGFGLQKLVPPVVVNMWSWAARGRAYISTSMEDRALRNAQRTRGL
jgi:hypothetical protein